MLLLSRKIGQVVIIKTSKGEKVRVTVVKTRGDSARLGFEATEDIEVDREEIAIVKEKAHGKNAH